MRVEAYLRIVSDEGAIRAIEMDTHISDARVSRRSAKRGSHDEEVWWTWATARIPIDPDNPDQGLKGLLLAHRRHFPIFKKYEREADIYLELVTRYEEGEEPSGLFLSAETVQLLSEMGGALDNDVVIVGKDV